VLALADQIIPQEKIRGDWGKAKKPLYLVRLKIVSDEEPSLNLHRVVWL
jgi:hypothetical protein